MRCEWRGSSVIRASRGRLIFRSKATQAAQYASHDFRDALKEYGIGQGRNRRAADSTRAYVGPMQFEQDWLTNSTMTLVRSFSPSKPACPPGSQLRFGTLHIAAVGWAQ